MFLRLLVRNRGEQLSPGAAKFRQVVTTDDEDLNPCNPRLKILRVEASRDRVHHAFFPRAQADEFVQGGIEKAAHA